MSEPTERRIEPTQTIPTGIQQQPATSTAAYPPPYQQSVLAPPQQPEPSPAQRRLQDLLARLVEKTTSLTVKVATCRCNHKESCQVYQKAREIAEIIDEIQEVRAEVRA
ncbi:MAG: hypothetical protein BA066_07335 [Candidatus Korarchaeota archaeon NZ13-K]|nr:MAG: hypothetical protein BA066_07335 [Candidatus Korarchaeota archaeon NZ13-K]